MNDNTELSAAGVVLAVIFGVALTLLGVWLISDGLAASLEDGVSFGRTSEVLAGIFLAFGTRRSA